MAINPRTFSLKSPLSVPAVNLSEEALCIAILVWFLRFNFSKTEWAKKYNQSLKQTSECSLKISD